MPFDYLKSYQTFPTVAEMDAAIAEHLTRYNLTKSERFILLRIAQSALKYPGAAHLKACTIAESVDVSTKTVYRAVKRLATLGMIRIVASTKLNGIKGANIYQILTVPSEMSYRVQAEEVHNDEAEELLADKETISFNLLKTSTLYEIYNDIGYLNDWQKTLYELMMSLPICDELRGGLYAAILATPIQTMREFTIARDTLLHIIRDVQQGKLTIQTTLRAIFKGAYNKAVVRPKIAEPTKKPSSKRPIVFYDWVLEREIEKV